MGVFLGDAALTLVVEVSLLLSFFLFYRLLALEFEAEEVGVYALFRRVLALVLPLALLGLTEGLARHLPEAHTRRPTRHILVAALSGVVFSSIALSITAMADTDFTARLVFGDVRFAHLVGPCVAFMLGLIAHSVVYGVLRGMLRIKTMNVLQLLNLGVIPILLLALGHPPVLGTLLTWLGLSTATIALLFIFAVRRSHASGGTEASVAQLYAYSVGRLPALLLSAALAAAVPLIAKGELRMLEVGYLSICISMLIGMAGLLSPLATVILPHLSALVSRNETRPIARRLPLLIGAALHIYLFATAQLLVFADYILEAWLGKQFAAAGAVLRVASFALIGFGFYACTRAVLDAVTHKPVNSLNALASCCVLMVLAAVDGPRVLGIDPVAYYAGVYAVAGIVLGLLTYRSLRRIFPDPDGGDVRHLAWGLGLCLATALIALALKSVVTSNLYYWLAFEAVTFVGYLSLIFALRFEWIRVLTARIIEPPMTEGPAK